MYSLDDLRRNDLARPAPRREAVEHHQRALLVHGIVELLLGLQVVHALLRHGCCEGAGKGFVWWQSIDEGRGKWCLAALKSATAQPCLCRGGGDLSRGLCECGSREGARGEHIYCGKRRRRWDVRSGKGVLWLQAPGRCCCRFLESRFSRRRLMTCGAGQSGEARFDTPDVATREGYATSLLMWKQDDVRTLCDRICGVAREWL